MEEMEEMEEEQGIVSQPESCETKPGVKCPLCNNEIASGFYCGHCGTKDCGD